MATSLTRATSVPNCNCKQAWAKFLITSTDLLRKTTKDINEITLYYLYHLRLEGARDVNFNRTNLINFILYLPTNNESLIWFKLVNVLMETTVFNSHREAFVISRWCPLHKRCCFLKKIILDSLTQRCLFEPSLIETDPGVPERNAFKNHKCILDCFLIISSWKGEHIWLLLHLYKL